MIDYIFRRLALIFPASLLINFIGYAYAYLVLPLRASRIPYVLQLSLGEREPLLRGYWTYLQGLARLDLGTRGLGPDSQALAEEVIRAIPATLGLLAIALILSALVGLILGLTAVHTTPPRRSRWLSLFATIGMAMPSFYIGILLFLAVFAYVLARPGRGLPLPVSGFGWDAHLILPTLALIVRPSVQIAQVTSGLLVDELGKQYVVTARSIGQSWKVIQRRHTMRNIVAAVVLTVAGSLRLLVGELILVEWLFRWPGLGYLFAQTLIPPHASRQMASAIQSASFLNPAIVATVLTVFAVLFLVVDLLASIAVRIVDPRLRAPASEEAGDV